MTQAAMIIARSYCEHYSRITSNDSWPCAACLSKGRTAVHELAGQGQIFDMTPDPPPLSDPSINSLGVGRRGGSDTSAAARYAVMPKTVSQRSRVLNEFVLCVNGGWTDDELIVRTGMSHQSVGPRRGELVAGHWLCDSGVRRPTRSGQDAIVWCLTETARIRLRAAEAS